jgi:hypothetical protein
MEAAEKRIVDEQEKALGVHGNGSAGGVLPTRLSVAGSGPDVMVIMNRSYSAEPPLENCRVATT